MGNTPLEGIPGWTDKHIQQLNAAWITTAEQVVALASTDRGIESLAEQLGASLSTVSQLVDSARQALRAEDRAELESPADTSQFGLGARRPPKEPGEKD